MTAVLQHYLPDDEIREPFLVCRTLGLLSGTRTINSSSSHIRNILRSLYRERIEYSCTRYKITKYTYMCILLLSEYSTNQHHQLLSQYRILQQNSPSQDMDNLLYSRTPYPWVWHSGLRGERCYQRAGKRNK